MVVDAKFFALLLNEPNEHMLVVYDRAIDVLGVLQLAYLFSCIDAHLAAKSKFAVKQDGSLRTRAGVAIALMKALPVADYLFGPGGERVRLQALDHAMQGLHRNFRAPPPRLNGPTSGARA